MRTEFLAYDSWSLAGDVGGMVGMLLGMSILALYDKFYHLVRLLHKVVHTGGSEKKQPINLEEVHK